MAYASLILILGTLVYLLLAFFRRYGDGGDYDRQMRAKSKAVQARDDAARRAALKDGSPWSPQRGAPSPLRATGDPLVVAGALGLAVISVDKRPTSDEVSRVESIVLARLSDPTTAKAAILASLTAFERVNDRLAVIEEAATLLDGPLKPGDKRRLLRLLEEAAGPQEAGSKTGFLLDRVRGRLNP